MLIKHIYFLDKKKQEIYFFDTNVASQQREFTPFYLQQII